MKKSLSLLLLSFISINLFGIVKGFNVIPSLEECLTGYKEAYKEFEPEAHLAYVVLKTIYAPNRRIDSYRYVTSANADKLDRYLKALERLKSQVMIRILIKSSCFSVASALASFIFKDHSSNQISRFVIFLAMAGCLPILLHENYKIKEVVPFYRMNLKFPFYIKEGVPYTLKKEPDLFSNTDLKYLSLRLCISSAVAFLVSGSTILISMSFI